MSESGLSNRIVTVLGGTGFLGRRIVHHLRDHGFGVRAASRHPEKARALFGTDDLHIEPISADIHDQASLANAIAGTTAVVNAVSLYVERGGATFHSVHVEAAGRVASEARKKGVERLIHVSGIGADPNSHSSYIRSRGRGEGVVCDGFPNATLIRPAVMFGPGDAFLTAIITLERRLPAYPMFGQGLTRLQPAYVEDVAEAIVATIASKTAPGMKFECAGPRVYSYAELLRTVAHAAGVKPILFPLPFAIWHALASIGEVLPNPPITRNQVELMAIDNVAAPDAPGFSRLGIAPQSIEAILPAMLAAPS
jgi:NADH dehydrogenase